MKWHKNQKIIDYNIKENQDAWRQRLFVSYKSSVKLVVKHNRVKDLTHGKENISALLNFKFHLITALLIVLCVQKENGHTIAQTRKEIEEKLALLEGKNSYWHNFQKDDVVQAKTMKQKKEQSEALGFGKVFE